MRPARSLIRRPGSSSTSTSPTTASRRIPRPTDPSREAPRLDPDLQRSRAPAFEVLLEWMDAPCGLRLQQLVPARRPGWVRRPEQRAVCKRQPGVADGINATWQFNVSGAVVLPFAIQAGVNFFGRQGFPIIYSVDVETHDALHQRIGLQVAPATTYRTPNVYQLDLQLARDFIIGSKVTVTPILACFNLAGQPHRARPRRLRRRFRQRGIGLHSSRVRHFNSVAEELGPRTIRGGVRISF